MSGRVVKGSKIAARLTLTALLTLAVLGPLTWCLGWSTGQAVARVSGPSCSVAPLAKHIRDTVTTRLALPAAGADPAAGETVGRIIVPRMSLDSPIVEMENCQDDANLNRGPGHIKGTALPGASGNCAIAGHRSTYSRPFSMMGSLQAGDEIILAGPSGARHAYKVSRIWVVTPGEVSVLDPTPEPSVTLITCHPAGSDATRLIVRAVLSN
jgi:LPXTG-site transpeptidase (sortase) family protein